jgi:hypothetical protein
MLAALLIMAVAATFALVVIGAVRSLQVVEGADAAGRRAGAAETAALAAVTRSLRWRPAEMTGSAVADDPPAKESWQAAWSPSPPSAGDVWPCVAVRVTSTARRASRTDDLLLDMCSEPWATGVTCGADAQIDSPFTVSGSGVYVGGCLRGRENVSFVAPPGSPVPAGALVDGVRGDVFAAAGVHAAAGIFAGGAEIHESPGREEYVDDTDWHVGETASPDWLTGPSAEVLLAARAEASTPGAALADGLLRLDDLPAAAGSDLTGGRCLLLPAADQVRIEGSAPDAGRLLIIVQGDATLGRPGEMLTLYGGLVVTGRVEVRGEVAIEGTLHCSSLSVTAPLSITVSPFWRVSPLPGAVLPTIVARG